MNTDDKLKQQQNEANPDNRNEKNKVNPTPLNGKVNSNPMRTAINQQDSPVQNPNRNLAKGGNNSPRSK